MKPAGLHDFSGSPFARMARVLVQEWALPVEPVEWTLPPADELWRVNPLGQVPALVEPGRAELFPTFPIIERLWEMAGRPPGAYDPARDRQTLPVTLAAGDALVTAYDIGRTGLRPAAPNRIGYDLSERNLDRFGTVLTWLEERDGAGSAESGITLPGVALACLVLWADARDGFPWRVHPVLAARVDALARRPSFGARLPRARAPGG